jgi:hypothetical protein
MATVHVFFSTGRFRSVEELRAFIDETYTENGEGVPSPFMREVALLGYEPGCIEAVYREQVARLSDLLAGASYADQWAPRLDPLPLADAAICVFEPNAVAHPHGSSLEYAGAFEYRVTFPEWFERLVRGE